MNNAWEHPVIDENTGTLSMYDGDVFGKDSDSSNDTLAFDRSQNGSPPTELYRYQQLTPAKPDYDPIIGNNFNLGDQVDAYRWQGKQPETWDQFDVALWIQYHAETLNLTNVRAEAFAGVDGVMMCNMSIDEFQQRDGTYGTELYVAFQHVLFTTQQYQQAYVHPQPTPNEYPVPDFTTSIERFINNVSFDRNDKFHSIDLPPIESFKTPVHPTPYVEAMIPKHEPREIESPPPSPTISEASTTSSNSKASRRGRGKGKLWEFVLNLLLNDETNPTIIKWEDRKNGVFRIVRSDQVAKLWGIRKSNPSMTYEKMSRAMRYTRSMGFLAELPEGHNYPRKLTFMMGQSAKGWQIN